MNCTDIWANLNQRQQAYLQCIYKVDQENEASENRRYHRGQSRRPADVWRWQRYGGTGWEKSRLKSLILAAVGIDQGTGNTFKALAKRDLILLRHGPSESFRIRLTTKGRKLVREGLGLSVPKKLPSGMLRSFHWEALVILYGAGSDGLRPYALIGGVKIPIDHGDYGGVRWRTWLRLRDHKDGAFLEEKLDEKKIYRIYITEAGRKHYIEYWEDYQSMYPEIEAPKP